MPLALTRPSRDAALAVQQRDFSRQHAHADPALAKGWRRTSASAGFRAAQRQSFSSRFFHSFCTVDAPAVVPPSGNTSPRRPSPRCCATSRQRWHPRRPCQGKNTLVCRSCPSLCRNSGESQFLREAEHAAGSAIASFPTSPGRRGTTAARAQHADVWSKSALVDSVGASQLHGICKFGLSFTKSICLIRLM